MHACTLVFIGRALAAPCKWRLLGWIDFYVKNLHLHAKSHSHWKGLCVPSITNLKAELPLPFYLSDLTAYWEFVIPVWGVVMIGNCFRSMLRTHLVLVLKSSARSNYTSLTNVDSRIVTWLVSWKTAQGYWSAIAKQQWTVRLVTLSNCEMLK